jgi:hypothetical protein
MDQQMSNSAHLYLGHVLKSVSHSFLLYKQLSIKILKRQERPDS